MIPLFSNRSASAATLAVCVLVLSGCKPASQPAAPDGLQPAVPRVASLAPSLTEIICALGGAPQLAGRSSACDFPPDVVRQVPVVGAFGVPSLERLMAVKPDRVLYTDLADPALDTKLRRIGLTPARIACSRLSEIPAAIREVGHALHRDDRATALAEDLLGRLDAIRKQPSTAPRPRVLVLIWHDPLMAAGRNTFIADLVNLAGGQNIGDEINRDYFQVSSEWVLARDPDIILCCFMSSTRPVRELVMNLPGWSRLSAVRQGRVYDGLDNNLIVRPGPRVMDGLELIRSRIIGIDNGGRIEQTRTP